MRYFFIAIVVVTFSCQPKRTESDGVNFMVKDKEDTLSHFFYPYYQDYFFMNKENFDSVVFNKDAQERLPGKYLFGLIEKDRFLNRYLTFRGDTNSSFEDFNQITELFLHEEYQLENYELAIYDDYIDSTTLPVSRHQMLVAVTPESHDTLLFQELNIAQKANYVAYSMITYETWEDRDEMHELLTDAISKMQKSTEVRQ